MKRALLLGGAVTAMLGAAPLSALADDAIISNTPIQLTQNQPAAEQVDAGSLVGQEVYDGSGSKVGDVDSVMVDQDGKVSSVVVDVSDWLESEKLIAVNWSDLQMGQDGRIVTSMTKENAQSAAAYQYKDENLRGQVMDESGERTAAAGAGAAGAAGANVEGVAADSALLNPDGSLNASKLIGLDVQSAQDQKVGDIGEVVVSKDGQVKGVVVDVGGFLGIATHPVLLDWEDVGLTSQNGTDRAVVNLDKQRLEQMPAYQSSSR
jgi:sporulation protein YlmC with PRC-barrel domain